MTWLVELILRIVVWLTPRNVVTDPILKWARTLKRLDAAEAPLMVAVLMFLAAFIGVVAGYLLSPFVHGEEDSASEIVVRNLKKQASDYKLLAEQASLKAAARSTQLGEMDTSGPWGIKWRWVSPRCEGGYNLVIERGQVTVFGKDAPMEGSGEALANGRFFVKFKIDTGKYMLTAEGSIGSRAGEAELRSVLDPHGEPYCQGPITVSREKLPDSLLGGGNGN